MSSLRTRVGELRRLIAEDFDPNEPRDPGGRWTAGGGAKKPIWQTPSGEYSQWDNPPAREPGESDEAHNKRKGEHYTVASQRNEEWTREMQRAVSRGDISEDDARSLGWGGVVERRMAPLPTEMWHVTTAASKVKATGLKTRAELHMDRGAGLGGGPDDTISFTDSEETAKQIRRAMLEMRDVASGKITPTTLIENARSGKDAKKPYLQPLLDGHLMSQGELDACVSGVERKEGGFGGGPPKRMNPTTRAFEPIAGFEPVKETEYAPGKFREYVRTKTPEERADDAVYLYKYLVALRERAGGPMDPLFFASDAAALAKVPDSEIQILKYEPVKTGMSAGYKVSALGEWRAFTGEAVRLVA